MQRHPQDRPLRPLRSLRGFTLIELLVVISIITLLVAILMPVLAKARQRVDEIKCMSQLRALGPATAAYAGDSRGFGPPHVNIGYAVDGGVVKPTPNWRNGRQATGDLPGFTGLDGYFGYSADTDEEEKFYSGTKGCPDYKRGLKTTLYSFTMNQWMLGLLQPGLSANKNRYTSLDDPRVKPSDTMIALENNTQSLSTPYYAPPLLTTLFDNIDGNGRYTYYGRHQGRGLNFLYVDGHASFLKWNGAEIENMPTVRIDD